MLLSNCINSSKTSLEIFNTPGPRTRPMLSVVRSRNIQDRLNPPTPATPLSPTTAEPDHPLASERGIDPTLVPHHYISIIRVSKGSLTRNVATCTPARIRKQLHQPLTTRSELG